MMKKVFLVLALVAMVAGSASAGYIWNVGASDMVNANAGSDVTLSSNMNLTADQGYTTATAAYAASVLYTGSLVDGTGFAKTKLLKTHMVTPAPTSWILQANGGADYTAAQFQLKIWGGTGSETSGTWHVFQLYNPVTNVWGRTELGSFTATSAAKGTKTAPLFSAPLAAFATGTPTGATQGYIFEMTNVVPEPGSMVAMLSGLVGLVGFGIRRRK